MRNISRISLIPYFYIGANLKIIVCDGLRNSEAYSPYLHPAPIYQKKKLLFPVRKLDKMWIILDVEVRIIQTIRDSMYMRVVPELMSSVARWKFRKSSHFQKKIRTPPIWVSNAKYFQAERQNEVFFTIGDSLFHFYP